MISSSDEEDEDSAILLLASFFWMENSGFCEIICDFYGAIIIVLLLFYMGMNMFGWGSVPPISWTASLCFLANSDCTK